MKKNIDLALLVSVVLLGGCAAAQWNRPETDEAQFNQDRYQCQLDAASMYPVPNASPATTPGPLLTDCTTYGASTSCTTRQGPARPDFYAQGQNSGAALGAMLGRGAAFNSCLESKGYRRQ